MREKMKDVLRAVLFLFCAVSPLIAGEVDVTNVSIKQESAGGYQFNVTLRHNDTGWDQYADRWEIIGPKGTVLATRVLAHPHVNEQPFTRSLSGVIIRPNIREVTIRAHDSVHGYGGEQQKIQIPRGKPTGK
jgi:hypothetical protein